MGRDNNAVLKEVGTCMNKKCADAAIKKYSTDSRSDLTAYVANKRSSAQSWSLLFSFCLCAQGGGCLLWIFCLNGCCCWHIRLFDKENDEDYSRVDDKSST